jgi:uncharacterized Zn-finger protein
LSGGNRYHPTIARVNGLGGKEMEHETIYVTENRVDCDGGGGALGHPRVFLELDADGQVVCPYCSRRFVREGVTVSADETEAGD